MQESWRPDFSLCSSVSQLLTFLIWWIGRTCTVSARGPWQNSKMSLSGHVGVSAT